MEEKFNLFELKTKDGFPVWDIIRNYVWERIIFTDYNHKSIKRNFFKKINMGVIFIFNSLKMLIYKGDFLFFSCSRFVNERGEYYDPYFNEIKRFIDNNYILYETVLGKNKYSDSKRIFSILGYFKILYRMLSFKRNIEIPISSKDKEIILYAIEITFGEAIFNETDIDNTLFNFRMEYIFYSKILRFKKIKKLLVHQNGYQKGLYQAAKDSKIPVFEFQHGEIVDSTMVWNYGPSKFLKSNNVIAPDVFFTYSDFWSNSANIPSTCIELGSSFFNTQIIKASGSNTITVISSKEQENCLNELTLKLENEDRIDTIYYKLHPGQFKDVERHKSYFKDYPKIKVISTEMNIMDMIYLSDEFIAIYSTAIFEVLQAGKIVYIYKRLNYKFFSKYFNLPGVHLFNKSDELFNIREKAIKSLSRQKVTSFFKPFNPNAFIEAIEMYQYK